MCGIAGHFGAVPLEERRVQSTLELMRTRGPDTRAARHFQRNGTSVSLLHSRLSIIDLTDRGGQPLTIGDYTIAFNGEIYNYLELKKELERSGVIFQSDSDTEVLLRLYIEKGEACLDELEGMWAFAVLHEPTGKLFLSRDRFAEKPLYYLDRGNHFYFGSEIKYLASLAGEKLVVNRRQLHRYLVNGYKSLYKAGETFFENVQEVPPGGNLTLMPGRPLESARYWEPRYRPRAMSTEEAVAGIRERLQESMRLRLRSDVPIAFCLSGGVDSTSLVSIAVKKFGQRAATFTIVDKDPRYDESDLVAHTIRDLGIANTAIHLEPARDFSELRSLIRYHDAPVATISYYIHSFLSRAISKAGFRVVVSGTAADELFTGYYDHFNLHLAEVRSNPTFAEHLKAWQEGIGKLVRNPHLSDPFRFVDNPRFRDHIYLKSDVYRGYLQEAFEEPFQETLFTDSLLRNRMLNELFFEATRVILHEDDLNSMCYSIENRSPFLDRNLFDFAYSIPSELLIQKGLGKYLLREAMDGIVNDRVRTNVHKKGFNASIHSVFSLSEEKFREELLSDGPIFRVVKKEAIENLVSESYLPNSDSKFLFNFINAKLFLEDFG